MEYQVKYIPAYNNSSGREYYYDKGCSVYFLIVGYDEYYNPIVMNSYCTIYY